MKLFEMYNLLLYEFPDIDYFLFFNESDGMLYYRRLTLRVRKEHIYL